MALLTPEWLTQGSQDLEAKKYRLLAYLQQIKKAYRRNALYPCLPDLQVAYEDLYALETSKNQLRKAFPKRLAKADLQNFRLIYKQLIEEDELSSLLSELLAFALPKLKSHLQEGQELHQLLEEQLELELLGLMPLYKREGYLILEISDDPFLRLYRFYYSQLSVSKQFHGNVRLTFLGNRKRRAYRLTPLQLKAELIALYPELPNPPLYYCIMRMPCPIEETTLPLVSRSLEKELAAA